MYAVVLLLAVSWASAENLLDAPEVKVDPLALQNFGVTLDEAQLNEQGLFERLVSITPSRNSSDPQIKELNEAANKTVQDLYDHILDHSAAEVSRKIIASYRPLSEGKLAQFISAHILNLYSRLFKIIDELNTNALTSLSQLNGIVTADHAQRLCESNDFIQIAAQKMGRSLGQTEACESLFEEMQNQREFVSNLIGETVTAKVNLNQMDIKLKSDTTPLKNVISFIKQNPVYPSIYKNYLIGQIGRNFMDYVAFFGKIENNEELTNVLGIPISEIRKNIMDFLQQEKLI